MIQSSYKVKIVLLHIKLVGILVVGIKISVKSGFLMPTTKGFAGDSGGFQNR